MALMVVSLTTFAKDNFKMIGSIDGAGNDTLCIEYPKDEVKIKLARYFHTTVGSLFFSE